jgi:hypothetical protein
LPDQLFVDNRKYTLARDFQSSYQVLASGLVRDALTGEAPAGPLSISLQLTKVAAIDQVMKSLIFIKVLGSGLFCLAGVPERIFPDLSTIDYTLGLQIQVPGYKSVQLPVSIPSKSIFPLKTLLQVDMQPLPIRIQGRVMGMTTTPTPLVGASVFLVDEPNTTLTEHVVALGSPLYFPHSAGTTVQQLPLTPSGATRHLATSASAGNQFLILKDSTGLGLGDILLISSQEASEYVIVDNLPHNVPGQVTLFNVLNYSYAAVAETTVQQYTPGAAGTSTTLSRPAHIGDGVLFLPISLSPASAGTIKLADATSSLVEYHALGAVTDKDGYYRLDGITQVQTVYMATSAAGYPAMKAPVAWTVDYTQPVNSVDLLLPVHP